MNVPSHLLIGFCCVLMGCGMNTTGTGEQEGVPDAGSNAPIHQSSSTDRLGNTDHVVNGNTAASSATSPVAGPANNTPTSSNSTSNTWGTWQALPPGSDAGAFPETEYQDPSCYDLSGNRLQYYAHSSTTQVLPLYLTATRQQLGTVTITACRPLQVIDIEMYFQHPQESFQHPQETRDSTGMFLEDGRLVIASALLTANSPSWNNQLELSPTQTARDDYLNLRTPATTVDFMLAAGQKLELSLEVMAEIVQKPIPPQQLKLHSSLVYVARHCAGQNCISMSDQGLQILMLQP